MILTGIYAALNSPFALETPFYTFRSDLDYQVAEFTVTQKATIISTPHGDFHSYRSQGRAQTSGHGVA
jgi:hypothetical protein